MVICGPPSPMRPCNCPCFISPMTVIGRSELTLPLAVVNFFSAPVAGGNPFLAASVEGFAPKAFFPRGEKGDQILPFAVFRVGGRPRLSDHYPAVDAAGVYFAGNRPDIDITV